MAVWVQPMRACDRARHEVECPMLQVACSHASGGCAVKMARRALPEHEQQCGHATVTCDVPMCAAQVKRLMLPKHNAKRAAHHVKLVLASVQVPFSVCLFEWSRRVVMLGSNDAPVAVVVWLLLCCRV